jgi:iron complex transport system ATP-binding protein
MTGPERRKKLSLLSQEGGAEPTLTVEELVGLTADLPGIEGGTDRVTEALQAVGLEALRSRRLHTLSGGELQRARLARVWAQNAAVVLLDEPTAAQDIEGAARWAAAVSRLRSRQRLVVVAMHDLSLAARVCDRWWLLSGGSLVAEGRPDDLLGSGAVERVFCDAVEVSRVGTQWWVRPRLPPAGGAE